MLSHRRSCWLERSVRQIIVSYTPASTSSLLSYASARHTQQHTRLRIFHCALSIALICVLFWCLYVVLCVVFLVVGRHRFGIGVHTQCRRRHSPLTHSIFPFISVHPACRRRRRGCRDALRNFRMHIAHSERVTHPHTFRGAFVFCRVCIVVCWLR